MVGKFFSVDSFVLRFLLSLHAQYASLALDMTLHIPYLVLVLQYFLRGCSALTVVWDFTARMDVRTHTHAFENFLLDDGLTPYTH